MADRVTFPVVVHTLVFDDAGRILLLRRANTGFMDGYYGLPGGHLQNAETVRDAACRECAEEAGIDITAIEPAVVMPFDGGVDFIFRASRWVGSARIGEPHKCDDIGWYAVDQLPRNVIPFVRKAIELSGSGTWFHQYDGGA